MLADISSLDQTRGSKPLLCVKAVLIGVRYAQYIFGSDN